MLLNRRPDLPRVTLGHVMGVKVTLHWSAVAGSLLLWIGLTGVGVAVLGFPLATAAWAALAATCLHWVSSLVHGLGHALAARRTGYPMRELRLYFLVAPTLYPRDEPPLPAEIHIQRALGGPLASLALAVVAGALAWAWRGTGALGWVMLYWFVENLVVYFLQMFVPLGFNDGATLYKWWGKRGAKP